MFKLLFWMVLGFVAYKYFLKPKQISEKRNGYREEPNYKEERGNSEEYIDYEEVD